MKHTFNELGGKINFPGEGEPMMKKYFFTGLFTALFVVIAPLTTAQVTQTGTVAGNVTDETGAGLRGVSVHIEGPNMLTKELNVYTNDRGVYRIPAVPPGKGYNLKAELAGFQTISKTDIWVRVGQTTKVDFQMNVAPVEAFMTVLGEAPVVDIEKTDIGENLDSAFMQHLPTGRTYQDVLLLIPGVTQNPNSEAGSNWNVHGSSVRDNAYLIDGVNTSDPATGTFSTRFNFDAIEEIEVKTGGYEAEFGQATGAVVNIVTKSGGNDFSGELNLYGITDALNSPRKDPETGQDYDETLLYEEVNPSINLGGPVLRDKIWFFGSYQYVWQNRTFNEDQSIPQEWRSHLINAKGTWQVNDENKIVAQFQGDPTRFMNLTQNPYVTEKAQPRKDQGGKFINTQWQSIINQNTLFNVQGAFRRQHLDYTNMDRDLDTIPWSDRVWDTEEGGYVTWLYGNVDNYQLSIRDRFQSNASLAYYKDDFWGTHDFKFGGELESSHLEIDWGTPGGVEYVYRSGENYRKTENISAVQEDSQLRFSLYAQDSWSPSPGLTLNLGVRFDNASPKNEVEKLWTWNTVAPRLGIAWDVLNDGKNVVRGNYSRFYLPIISQYVVTFSTEYLIYTTYDWDPDTGEWVFRNRSGAAGSTELQDGLSAPYTDEFSAGYEREVYRDLALGANVIYRRTRNFIEDQEINFGWDGLGGTTGSGEFVNDGGADGSGDFRYELRNIEGSKVDYKALELTARKNFSNNWQLLGSYVLSKAEGNVMGDYSGSSSIAPEWDTPAIAGNGFGPYGVNQYGLMNHDQRHVFKLSGTYFFPYGINAGATYSFVTGTPYNHYYWHDGYSGFYILREPRGQLNYDNRHNLDLRAEKTFELPWGNLGFLVDFFNIFNDGSVIRVREWGEHAGPDFDDNDDFSRFGEIRERVAPRRLQFGVRFTF